MVRSKFPVFFALTAWFFATGAQWDLVQTFAWGRMVASYSETMPLLEAVKKTFSGDLCEICVTVQDAKRADDRGTPAAGSKVTVKALLVFAPAEVAVADFVPFSASMILATAVPSSAARAAPPTPPPRSFA